MANHTVKFSTDEHTMNGMVQLCNALLNGALKDPKMQFGSMMRSHVQQFMRDYQASLMNDMREG